MEEEKSPSPESMVMPPPAEPSKQQKVELEKIEEQKLKSKFPGLPARPLAGGGGHSAFLQKRLTKGQKYFDSGDYQMAKQKVRRFSVNFSSIFSVSYFLSEPHGRWPYGYADPGPAADRRGPPDARHRAGQEELHHSAGPRDQRTARSALASGTRTAAQEPGGGEPLHISTKQGGAPRTL